MTQSSVKAQLAHFIRTFEAPQILVIGDLMLDQYAWGQVSRISPEAPIPVVKVDRDEYRLGGAASVISNLAALGVRPMTVGLLGDDEQGHRFKKLFETAGLDASGLVVSPDFSTIVKIRVLTTQQQMIRLDYESNTAVSDSLREQLKARIAAKLPLADGVVLSNYAKGVFDPELIRWCIDTANAQGIPIIADPGKGVALDVYRGVTTIKPNRTEAEAASGIKIVDQPSLIQAAQAIQDIVQAQFLSLSVDRDGLFFFANPQENHLYPTEVHEVFDVTGAGDMVITILSVMLSLKAPPSLAFPMANIAAELEIGHMGVVPLPWNEILNRIESGESMTKLARLEELVQEQQQDPSPLIFTNGYFDQLNAGHLRFLLEAGKISGRLVVALNSDQTIIKQKGSQPLLNEMERVRLLASLENVKRILVFDQEDASELILALRPTVVVKGEGFRGKALAESSAIAEVGATITYVPEFRFGQTP